MSEHLDLPEMDYLGGAYTDRMANSGHVELLGSLVDLKGGCVLEIRPKTGAILAALRRLYGAEVYALPIFESQQYVAQKLYDVTASALVDFDRFSIPYDRKFDLVIANHMLTHAVRPRELFDALHNRLRPTGGCIKTLIWAATGGDLGLNRRGMGGRCPARRTKPAGGGTRLGVAKAVACG